MFKIHNIVLFHNDRFTFYYTQSVPYPGNFWSRYTGVGAQKIEQYSTQKFLFIRQINSFLLSVLKVGHLTRLLLSQLWYGRRKPRKFHTHKKKRQPKFPCTIIVTSYWTCDRWPFRKTWTLFLRVSELLLVGIDCYRFLLLSFPSRKNKPVENKIPRSFPPT